MSEQRQAGSTDKDQAFSVMVDRLVLVQEAFVVLGDHLRNVGFSVDEWRDAVDYVDEWRNAVDSKGMERQT